MVQLNQGSNLLSIRTSVMPSPGNNLFCSGPHLVKAVIKWYRKQLHIPGLQVQKYNFSSWHSLLFDHQGTLGPIGEQD